MIELDNLHLWYNTAFLSKGAKYYILHLLQFCLVILNDRLAYYKFPFFSIIKNLMPCAYSD